MKIGGIYSFNGGREAMETDYAHELEEIRDVIMHVDARKLKTKISEEKTMSGKKLYSPTAMNAVFAGEFAKYGWFKHREYCDYPTEFYTPDYEPCAPDLRNGYREMDFVKNRVGVEVQLGKYAFMVYNVAAKMTIFRNLGLIDVGVEIVPLKELQAEMSTGISYFEQFVWDLERRGVADIDIPVMILGIVPEV